VGILSLASLADSFHNISALIGFLYVFSWQTVKENRSMGPDISESCQQAGQGKGMPT